LGWSLLLLVVLLAILLLCSALVYLHDTLGHRLGGGDTLDDLEDVLVG